MMNGAGSAGSAQWEKGVRGCECIWCRATREEMGNYAVPPAPLAMPEIELPQLPLPKITIDQDSWPDPADPLMRSKREQEGISIVDYSRKVAQYAAAAQVSVLISKLDAFRQELVELKRALA